ncbi:F-box/LRR-repeat protein 8 [Chanos chanos]|uniref:F-box/LRR-repeat protein 8 n=1 Tax=Chanos chanos TaxID=29144 RepID=A0A6J2UQN8_CHACN|nr:F-box/LRR-repeat protein 8 [Chanos chanos]
MDLPEEVLAYIFSFLPMRDRYNAFTVCKAWSRSMIYSSVWKYTEVRCEGGVDILQTFSAYLPLITKLRLCVGLEDPANRSSALCALQQAVAKGEGQLRALCVDCTGNARLFDAGQDLLKGLVDTLAYRPLLTVLDLRGVPFTLNDNFVRSVAKSCPKLHGLFINNPSLVCGVTTETMREVLNLCPGIIALGVFHASLSPAVIGDLLLPGRPSLQQLELRCERSLKYTPPLGDEIWVELRYRHPNLWVELVLDHTLPELRVPLVLLPSIPVRHLRLLTWTLLLDEINLVGSSYANTLETLELQTPASRELNSALVTLATQCVNLKEVHCYCVVSQEVITAFRENCCLLQRYTLKTHKEPHPWTCTILK